MEFDDLEAFLAVVDHGGFRRAAGALFLSQASLSRRVLRLERELGTTLLERGARGVHPTPQGVTLATGGRRLLATLEEVRATTSGNWSDNIVVACTSIATGTYLSEFLVDWIPRHPSTRVTIIEDDPVATRRRLMESGCDAALVAAPLDRDVDGLPIARAQVRAILPPGHRLGAETGPLSVSELHDEPVLINGEHYFSGRILFAASIVAGVRPRVIFESTVGSTLVALAQAGIGIAVLSDAADTPPYDLATRPLTDAAGHLLGFDLYIAWTRQRALNPIVAEFGSELSAFTRARREHVDT